MSLFDLWYIYIYLSFNVSTKSWYEIDLWVTDRQSLVNKGNLDLSTGFDNVNGPPEKKIVPISFRISLRWPIDIVQPS